MCSDIAGRRARGFTLIELLITVAVIAVLAAVSYSSYQSSVLRSRRADAKAALTEASQRLERYYTENNKYVGAAFCDPAVDAGCTDATRVYNRYSENSYYTIGFFGTPTVSTYTIEAVPQGSQYADVCGKFRLDQAGTRRVSDGSETDEKKCW